jgi:tetratricopeptide (TPR) repeat protein
MGDGEEKLTLLRIHAAAATGEVDAALDELDAILRRRPDQWDAHVFKARLLADQGRAVECIAAWTAATRLRPESSQALSGLGAALAAAERYEEAVEFLTRVAQLNPTSSDAYLDLAAVLRKAHQLEDAEWAARSAVEVAPSSAHAHHDLGLVLEAAGQLDEAVASYREAIGRRGDWTPPYLALARVLERTGRIEDAIHTLEKAAAVPSADSDTQAEISAALAGLRARAPNQRAFAGRLDAFSMWQILELLQNHRSTGHLELSLEGSVTEIFVRDGHLVRIVSDHAPRLAEIVPAVPGVDARRLAAVMDGYQQQSDARVAQHLLHFGVLDATKLRAAMETRLRTALDRILDSDDGTFTFQRQTVEPSATDVDLDIRFVLLDIVRSRDAAATGGGAEVADDDDQEVRLIDSETRPPKQPG